MDFSPPWISRKNTPSQGVLHVLPLNVSPEKAQRLGVVLAFWELGVVTLHGTEATRAQGGRMQETTGPGVSLQGKGGGSTSQVLFGDPFPHRWSHSCISRWQVVALPKHPACVLDAYLRMTKRVLAFVTNDG